MLLNSLRDNPAWSLILWIDARPQPIFDVGHIPGAVRLTEAEWETLLPAVIDAWQPERRIVVYCGGEECDASLAVASRLKRELGLSTVEVLSGGWPAWEASRP